METRRTMKICGRRWGKGKESHSERRKALVKAMEYEGKAEEAAHSRHRQAVQ